MRFNLEESFSWVEKKDIRSFVLFVYKKLHVKMKFVGGCVRDSLLNIPFEDYDLAVDCEIGKLYSFLKKENFKVLPTGLKHGTITVLLGKDSFEITNLRKDLHTDGRWAETRYVNSWFEDAKRRDFTINAIYFDPLNKECSDFHGGLVDLSRRIVRFIGDPFKRIEEDFLRILRFYRFSCYYAENLHVSSLNACIKMQKKITFLSSERIQQELRKIFGCNRSYFVISEMVNNGFLKIIFPSFETDLKRFFSLLKSRSSYSKDWIVRFFSLFKIDTLEKIKYIKTRLRLSNSDVNELKSFLIKLPVTLDEISLKRFIYYNSKKILYILLILNNINCNNYSYLDDWQVPVFPIKGKDFLMRGVMGKRIGKLKDKLEKWWVSRNFTPGYNDCLKYLDSIIEKNG